MKKTLDQLLDDLESAARAEPASYRDGAGPRSERLMVARWAIKDLAFARSRSRDGAKAMAATFVLVALAAVVHAINQRSRTPDPCESRVDEVPLSEPMFGARLPPCPRGTRTTYAPLRPEHAMPDAYGCMCPGERAPWETQGGGR